jgi:hypothetical protein
MQHAVAEPTCRTMHTKMSTQQLSRPGWLASLGRMARGARLNDEWQGREGRAAVGQCRNAVVIGSVYRCEANVILLDNAWVERVEV